MIDLYCEREVAAFWAEPVNAISNAAILLAAFAAWREAESRQQATPTTIGLVLLIAAIGLGSFLFHTFATRWAMLADVAPIAAFQLLYLWIYARDVMAWPPKLRGAAVGTLLAGMLASVPLVSYANGSLMYLPALLTLLLLGLAHTRQITRERFVLLIAAVLFVLSLTLRTIDLAACTHFAQGTHFAWHLLNALVLYLVMRGLLTARERDTG